MCAIPLGLLATAGLSLVEGLALSLPRVLSSCLAPSVKRDLPAAPPRVVWFTARGRRLATAAHDKIRIPRAAFGAAQQPRSSADQQNPTAGLQSPLALRAFDQLSRQSPVPSHRTVGSGSKCELPVRPESWDTDADWLSRVCEKPKSGAAGQSGRLRH